MCNRKAEMTGYNSKKMSAEIRWIGPYMPNLKSDIEYAKRHADEVTIDHIVDLRKRLMEAEGKVLEVSRQRDNALDMVMTLHKQLKALQ